MKFVEHRRMQTVESDSGDNSTVAIKYHSFIHSFIDHFMIGRIKYILFWNSYVLVYRSFIQIPRRTIVCPYILVYKLITVPRVMYKQIRTHNKVREREWRSLFVNIIISFVTSTSQHIMHTHSFLDSNHFYCYYFHSLSFSVPIQFYF